MIAVHGTHVTDVFTGFGSRGVGRSGGRNGAGRVTAYIASGDAVGPHFADQLLLPMALVARRGGPGGLFITQAPTLHTRTNAQVIRQFTGAETTFTEAGRDLYRVEVAGPH